MFTNPEITGAEWKLTKLVRKRQKHFHWLLVSSTQQVICWYDICLFTEGTKSVQNAGAQNLDIVFNQTKNIVVAFDYPSCITGWVTTEKLHVLLFTVSLITWRALRIPLSRRRNTLLLPLRLPSWHSQSSWEIHWPLLLSRKQSLYVDQLTIFSFLWLSPIWSLERLLCHFTSLILLLHSSGRKVKLFKRFTTLLT